MKVYKVIDLDCCKRELEQGFHRDIETGKGILVTEDGRTYRGYQINPLLDKIVAIKDPYGVYATGEVNYSELIVKDGGNVKKLNKGDPRSYSVNSYRESSALINMSKGRPTVLRKEEDTFRELDETEIKHLFYEQGIICMPGNSQIKPEKTLPRKIIDTIY